MFGVTIPHYAATNIRHNNKEFELGHRFTSEELKLFASEDLERLTKSGVITTDRTKINRLLAIIDETNKQFNATREAYALRNGRP